MTSSFHNYILQDHILNALYHHQILWGDIPFTPQEEKDYQGWLQQPEQIQLQFNIQQELKNISLNTVRTIIARNLPRNISTSELYNIFEMYGTVEHIVVPYHLNPSSPYYGTMKGYAFIKFISSEDAYEACSPQSSNTSYIILSNKIVTLELAKEDR